MGLPNRGGPSLLLLQALPGPPSLSMPATATPSRSAGPRESKLFVMEPDLGGPAGGGPAVLTGYFPSAESPEKISIPGGLAGRGPPVFVLKVPGRKAGGKISSRAAELAAVQPFPSGITQAEKVAGREPFRAATRAALKPFSAANPQAENPSGKWILTQPSKALRKSLPSPASRESRTDRGLPQLMAMTWATVQPAAPARPYSEKLFRSFKIAAANRATVQALSRKTPSRRILPGAFPPAQGCANIQKLPLTLSSPAS